MIGLTKGENFAPRQHITTYQYILINMLLYIDRNKRLNHVCNVCLMNIALMAIVFFTVLRMIKLISMCLYCNRVGPLVGPLIASVRAATEVSCVSHFMYLSLPVTSPCLLSVLLYSMVIKLCKLSN
jgi:hypothetical protein